MENPSCFENEASGGTMRTAQGHASLYLGITFQLE
jgi:hypothetical protein